MKPLATALSMVSSSAASRLNAALELAATKNIRLFLVGGTARLIGGGDVFARPITDIDILVEGSDQEQFQEIVRILSDTAPEQHVDSGSCGGQKFDIDGVKIDVWRGSVVNWLEGVPCNGDAFAIGFDGTLYSTDRFMSGVPYDQNPAWPGDSDKALDYIRTHRNKLARDVALVEGCRTRIENNYIFPPLV